MAGKQIVVAFDLYGTLLSTTSIANRLEKQFGQQAQAISTLMRRYQLEYTWRLNSMGRFDSFANVTRNALVHALADHGLSLNEPDISSVMTEYDNLSTFPDVNPALNRLSTIPNLTAVVFSNGTDSMVSNSVHKSKDLSPHSAAFRDIVTVDEVKQFKPAPASYYHLMQKMGKTESQMGDLWLVSGNPFDVVGARSCGMNAIWVDRAHAGWHDAACPKLQPTAIVNSLEHIIDKIGGQ